MQNRPSNKDYHFFKSQLYDFMYLEGLKEVFGPAGEDEGDQESREDKKRGQAIVFLSLSVLLRVSFFILVPFLTAVIPGVPLFIPFVMICFLGSVIFPSIFYDIIKYDGLGTTANNQPSEWLQRPNFFGLFPSLLKIALRTTAWLHDMVAAAPRLVRYYARKGTENATFEDSIKRGGAWGSLIGSICTIGAVVVVGALLFNPYSLLGIAGIAATVGLFLIVAPRIVKGFEFLGRLAGIFYTKKQAERELKLQSIINNKQGKDRHPACTVAFVNELPTNNDLTKMQENGKEIPHYYYHRDENDTHLSWTCYSVDYLPSGKVEANLKPCYKVKIESPPTISQAPADENKQKAKINENFSKTLKNNTDKIYEKYKKYTAENPPESKEKQTPSIMVLNRVEADSLQLEPRTVDFTKKENFPTQIPKRKVFRSTSQICWLALQDCLKPRNYAGRPSAGSIIFDPSYTSPNRLAALNEKGAHLESKKGIDNIKRFLPLYDCYALTFKENLSTRRSREDSDATQEGMPDNVTSLMAEYLNI